MSVVCRYIIETDGWRQAGGDRQVCEREGRHETGGPQEEQWLLWQQLMKIQLNT